MRKLECHGLIGINVNMFRFYAREKLVEGLYFLALAPFLKTRPNEMNELESRLDCRIQTKLIKLGFLFHK